jgi:hypothetical protein
MKKKRVILFILGVLGAYFILDLYKWVNGDLPMTNPLIRTLNGAPRIEIKGNTLIYSTKLSYVDYPKEYFVPFTESDEGIKLFKAKSIPDGMLPPWIFVLKESFVFRYKAAQNSTIFPLNDQDN